METPDEKRTLYKIKIQGHPDHFTALWNGDMRILRSENNETLFVCRILDQAALRGFLNQLWNLNFTILTIERIENMPDDFSRSPENGRK